jgi:hypothetical protein
MVTPRKLYNKECFLMQREPRDMERKDEYLEEEGEKV